MTETTIAVGVCLGEDAWLEMEDFARACGARIDFIRTLIEEGLLEPAGTVPRWRFGGDELARVRRIRRLQRDFDANLASVAVMLDLMDEIERLRARLVRAGLED